MNCPKCGAPNNPAASYCLNCGSLLYEPSPAKKRGKNTAIVAVVVGVLVIVLIIAGLVATLTSSNSEGVNNSTTTQSTNDQKVVTVSSLGLSFEATDYVIATNKSQYPAPYIGSLQDGYYTVFIQLKFTNLYDYTNENSRYVSLDIDLSNGDWKMGWSLNSQPSILQGQSYSVWYAFDVPIGLDVSRAWLGHGETIPLPASR